MSYRLNRFGDVLLPCARLTGAYGTGPTVDGTLPVIGGMSDSYASDYGNLLVPYEMTYSAWIVDAEADAQTKLAELHSMRGQRHILYREVEDTDDYHWCWARCLQVRNPWQLQRRTMNPVDIVFQVQTPWYGVVHGTGWSLDDNEALAYPALYTAATTHTLDFASNDLVVTNPGNVTTRLVSVRITPSGFNTSNIQMAVGPCQIKWTDNLTDGHVLEINGRTMSVTVDDADAYDAFELGPAHTSGWWLELEPGANTVTVDHTMYGGIGEVQVVFDFAAGWG